MRRHILLIVVLAVLCMAAAWPVKNGVGIVPGSDTDADIITVSVTGTPKVIWDESADLFSFNKGVSLLGDLYGYTGGDDAEIFLETYSYNGADYSRVRLHKSDHNTVGTLAQTDNGDILGAITFHGANTTPVFTAGSRIYAYQAGAAGAFVPSRLVLEASDSAGAFSNQLMLSNDGNVGINTSSPDTLFHISKDVATPVIRLERADTAVSSSDIVARIEVETTDETDPGICAAIEALAYSTDAEVGWRFKTGTPSALVEAVQIDQNGLVGIGTPWPDSPDTVLHLQHATDPYLRFTRDDTTVTADELIGKIEFETKDSGSAGVGAYINAIAEGTDGEVGLAFATGTGGSAVERMRIDEDGAITVKESLQVGSDTVYSTFYSDEGDIYSDDGKMYMGAGINTIAERYGVGFQCRESARDKTVAYDIDASFTVATATIEKAGETFLSDDPGPRIGDMLVVTNANDTSYIGSTGEIINVTETKIVVSLAAAGDNVPDDLTDVDIVVFNHPIMAVLDNGDIHFNVGVSPDASFKVHADDSNNGHAVHFVVNAGVDGNAALEIEYDANGYADASSIEVNFDATAFADADTIGTVLDVIINNIGSSDGDVHAMDVALSDTTNTDMEVEAVATHEGVDPIGQYLGDPAVLLQAYITDTDGDIGPIATISFSDANPDEILDSGDGFVAAGFVAGQVITVTGDSDNNDTYTIASVAIGTIVLEAGDELSNEVAGDDVTIASTFRDVEVALNAAGTDVTLFDADNDVLLIASTKKWDEINVILDTEASHTIIPTFHFIEDDGDWILFAPADDTDGFSSSATIRGNSDNLATWGRRSVNEVVGAVGATDYYWQKITRTRNNLVTSPIEDTIQVTTLGTKFMWNKDGNVNINTIAVVDGIAAPDAIVGQAIIYVDTDTGDLRVVFGDGTRTTIATD